MPPPPVLATDEALSTAAAATAARTTRRQPTVDARSSFRPAPLASATGEQWYRRCGSRSRYRSARSQALRSRMRRARAIALASGTPAPTNSMLPRAPDTSCCPLGSRVLQRRGRRLCRTPRRLPSRVEVKTTPPATVAQPNRLREPHRPDRAVRAPGRARRARPGPLRDVHGAEDW